MMGTKERNFQPLPEDISIEDLHAPFIETIQPLQHIQCPRSR